MATSAPPSEPLWRPTPERIARSQLTAFTRIAAERAGRALADYGALHDWSISEPEQFWSLVWQFTGVIGHRGERILDAGDRFPGARWFPDARLNFAENLLNFADDRPALISVLETDDPGAPGRTLSYGELKSATAALATYLAGCGVGPGDRVAGWLPNVPETVIGMLAAASLGAVWTSCSPDFGAEGALDRFGQTSPKVLIACDGYTYNGRVQDISRSVLEVGRSLPDLAAIVWVERIGTCPADAARFHEVAAAPAGAPVFRPMGFSDPLYILYSSGTTGKPKCIVHGVGGTLLQHLKEHRLHVDLVPDDRLFYFTTCGWMMWNWLVSGLATGCTLVLYEGAPTWPDPDRLFAMAEALGISVFGTSARYLSALAKSGARPRDRFDLRPLRALLSTGSPLAPEGFRYVYDAIKPDVHLASISGGTDIVSCFVLGNPNGPVWAGEIQAPGLGMAVSVWDQDGNPVRGEKGELVCTRPFPSTPIGFWDDPTGERYLDAYFRRFPGVWTHGDLAALTEHHGYVIYGRSDAVLNPGGVRIGTAEIYRVLEKLAEVTDAVCVAQDWQGDVRIVLFVVLRPGQTLDAGLVDRIRAAIRNRTTPRHVPAVVLQVPDVPRTISGKVVELAVRDVIHGRQVHNLNALANPEALEHFRDRAELALTDQAG
ncbi:MAG TPA: acetoacetate--CoA ligase [Pseudomonadales bacterium]